PTLPGQPWTVQGWGTTSSSDPRVTLEGPRLSAPGDNRSLGRLVKEMAIYAPEARLRALADLALMALGAGLMYACVVLWSGRPGLALLLSAAVPAVLGLLVVYRDRWMQTIAWALPVVFLVLLLVSARIGRRGMPSIRSKWTALWACLALTAALFLIVLGYMNAFDSDRMYQMTAGLFEYGAPTRYPGQETWTKYGFGQSLIGVPFYALGKLLLQFGGTLDPLTRFTVSLTNLALTAATCWLLYVAARRFASPGVSVTVAATYLLCTPALNYARTFFSEPAGAALLLAGLLLIIPTRKGESTRPWRILLAGLCLGAMFWFKPAFAIYIPAPGLAVLWQAWHDRALVQVRERFRAAICAGLLFAVGPIIGLLVQVGYNYVRYGDLANGLLRTGYEREPGFSTPLLEGLGGLLLSPGKSVFLYAPVLLLVPIGLWLMYRSGSGLGRITVVLILTESAVGFVFNAMWWAWTGNFAWGPRLVMPVLPLLVWPLASVGHLILKKRETRGEPQSDAWVRYIVTGAWVVLGVLGALVSIPGALVDFQVYYRLHGLLLAGDPGESATIYDPAESPLVVEPGYLLNGLTAAIHRPTLADAGMGSDWDVAVPAALVIAGGVCLWLSLRRADRA
ncbi:MAG TPA: glycosyltransferase family 39 protein, partial [Chloroflexia bacterium]|nr:glycosyltransferase family 39 protein [Chloroflexia bacterium]